MLRVLITRLSAVGDCIHTMPLVGVLRRQFPDAYIAWVTQPGPATLLDRYPGLDEVITVPRGWMSSWHVIAELRRQLRQRKFDVVIDPQGLSKSSLLGWLSGTRRRIGFTAPQGRELSRWLNTERIRPTADHVVDRYLQLLTPLCRIPQGPVRFELASWDHPAVQDFQSHPALSNGYAVMNPGAGWDSKLWLPERFAEVARYLGTVHQLPSVVTWAGSRERAWAEQIVAASHGHGRLAPDTKLPELATLMRGATICVGNDTGPVHLAAAVGVPCVGLYGSTRPAVCGPYGAEHRTVQAYYQDGSCRARRSASNDAMRAITTPMVQAACDEVLAAVRTRHAA